MYLLFYTSMIKSNGMLYLLTGSNCQRVEAGEYSAPYLQWKHPILTVDIILRTLRPLFLCPPPPCITGHSGPGFVIRWFNGRLIQRVRSKRKFDFRLYLDQTSMNFFTIEKSSNKETQENLDQDPNSCKIGNFSSVSTIVNIKRLYLKTYLSDRPDNGPVC